jgi:predicted nucleic acid-binding protein
VIALDTSACSRYFDDIRDERSIAAGAALEERVAVFPPVVVTELLSNLQITEAAKALVSNTPMLPLLDGYWQRAAVLRSNVLLRGLKAAVADCLIAQSCIDHDIPLITYDRDFRHFMPAGLKLL